MAVKSLQAHKDLLAEMRLAPVRLTRFLTLRVTPLTPDTLSVVICGRCPTNANKLGCGPLVGTLEYFLLMAFYTLSLLHFPLPHFKRPHFIPPSVLLALSPRTPWNIFPNFNTNCRSHGANIAQHFNPGSWYHRRLMPYGKRNVVTFA